MARGFALYPRPPISSRRELRSTMPASKSTQLVLKRDIYYTLQPAESDQMSLDDLPQDRARAAFSTCWQTPPDTPAWARLQLATIRWDPAAISCWETTARGAGTAGPGAERTRSSRTFPAAAGMIRGAKAGRCPSR